jgi:hypothetical protein
MSEILSLASNNRNIHHYDIFSGPEPPGWISYTHPEGARYFFHEQKVRIIWLHSVVL